jgi:hypothetical protein
MNYIVEKCLKNQSIKWGCHMKFRYILPIVAASVALASCATTPVPVASNFPASVQKVARTAQHWDVVANSVVEQTLLAINSNPMLQKRSIYLQRPSGVNAFNVSFHDFLINHMVGRGASVNVCKPAQSGGAGFEMDGKPVDVTYEARVIQHNGIAHYRPGEWVALGTGVAALYNASSNWSHSEIWGAGIGLGVLAELARNSWPGSTNTELVVTTTIAENNRYIFRRSDIYYIADADAGLYLKRVKFNSNCPEDQVLANESSSNASKEEERVRMFLKDNARHKDNYWSYAK